MSTVTGPASAKVFKCIEPEFDKGKRVITLARTDRLWAGIQYVKEGGENNLHSHSHMDGIYFVIKGRAKFYGEGDVLIGDVGPNEGMLITRGYPYWFESVGEEALELLLVDAFDRSMSDPKTVDADRVDHQSRKAVQLSGTHVEEDATAR
jgi:mannose-6-phosphate isomerase-like protein (cupin superfamily)